jgi:hypothetical protein
VTLELPQQLLALCKVDNARPEVLLRGFIADMACIEYWKTSTGVYFTDGSGERCPAIAYYDRVG